MRTRAGRRAVRVTALAAVGAAALLAAGPAVAAKLPGTVRIAFTGSAQGHYRDVQDYITVDENECYSRQTVEERTSFRWTLAWQPVSIRGLARAASSLRARSVGHDGTIAGDQVRDSCEAPLEEAPPDWLGSDHCEAKLAVTGGGSVAISAIGDTLTLALQAPRFAAPLGSTCELTIRSDQLTAHVPLSLRALAALPRGKTISLPVGVRNPGPGDAYSTDFNCSHATKPYEGYRLVDTCLDQLAWEGTVHLTKL